MAKSYGIWMKRVLLFFAILLSYALQASAQEVAQVAKTDNFPTLKFCRADFSGNQTRCYTREFLERRGNEIIFHALEEGSTEQKELVMVSQDGYFATKIHPLGGSIIYTPHGFGIKFPMQVGSTWKGTYDQVTAGQPAKSRTRTVEVVGYGEVQVKAGKFKAYELQSFNQWNQAKKPAMEHYYYVPELGAVVLYESRELNGREEVVEVQPSPPLATGSVKP